METRFLQMSYCCYKPQQVLLLVGLNGPTRYFSALSNCGPTIAGPLSNTPSYAHYISCIFTTHWLSLLKSSTALEGTPDEDVYRTPNHQYPSNQRPAIYWARLFHWQPQQDRPARVATRRPAPAGTKTPSLKKKAHIFPDNRPHRRRFHLADLNRQIPPDSLAQFFESPTPLKFAFYYHPDSDAVILIWTRFPATSSTKKMHTQNRARRDLTWYAKKEGIERVETVRSTLKWHVKI